MFENRAAAHHMVSPSLVLSESLGSSVSRSVGFVFILWNFLEVLGEDYAVCVCTGLFALSVFPLLAY